MVSNQDDLKISDEDNLAEAEHVTAVSTTNFHFNVNLLVRNFLQQ